MSRQGLDRDESLNRIRQTKEPWDLLVVGGGATGVGVAMDAASRGLRVLLLEQADFGKGTSSRSTKLVHGGVRYLQQGNINLVRQALHERSLLLKNAPHLVTDMPFVIPCRTHWSRIYYGLGLKIYDWLSGSHSFGRSHGVSREETISMFPGLNAKGLRAGIVYHDGQFDDARLLINMARTAHEQGAWLANYFGVTGLTRNLHDQINGVSAVDLESGESFAIEARCVVNAAGPFCDQIRRMENPESEGMLSASQGVHLVLPRRFFPGNASMIVPKTSDGRVIFVIPWHDRVIVGTTDTAIDNLSLEPKPQAEEVDFLLETVSDYLVNLPSRHDIVAVFTGIRPLVKNDRSKRTASLSRDHVIRFSKHGLVTITGGKWTTVRKMAEDCVNRIVREFRFEANPCKTKFLEIHGAEQDARVANDPRAYYGSDLRRVRELERQHPELGEKLSPDLVMRKSDIIWAVRYEMARTVDDVLARRTRSLLLDARATLEVAPKVIRILAAELGRDSAWCEQQKRDFQAISDHYLPCFDGEIST